MYNLQKEGPDFHVFVKRALRTEWFSTADLEELSTSFPWLKGSSWVKNSLRSTGYL